MKINTFALEDWQNTSKYLLIGGTLVAAFGFLLGWFKIDEDAQWWYEPTQLITYEDVPGVAAILVFYAALLALSFFCDRRMIAGSIVFLEVVTLLATMIIVILAGADALDSIGDSRNGLDDLIWGGGVLFIVPGHAMILLGAITNWVLQIIDRLVIPGSDG